MALGSLCILLVAACSDGGPFVARRAIAPDAAPAPMAMKMAGAGRGIAAQASMASAPAIPRTGDALAYEHSVQIELGKEDLPKRIVEVQTACASNKDIGCTLLDVSTEGRLGVPSGSIRMRLSPAGVEPIITLAAKGGEITARNTHAEDLAEPVADTERELALMTTHRDRLAEFMKSKELKVEQLISVSKELATVQSQLDSLSTQRANLRRRIDTELLTINLTLPHEAVDREQHPVKDAFSSFASQMWEAIGDIIQFVAYFLPWLLVIVPGLVLLRLFWRWMSGWIARREARSRT